MIEELDEKKNVALKATWEKVNRDFGSIFSTLLPVRARPRTSPPPLPPAHTLRLAHAHRLRAHLTHVALRLTPAAAARSLARYCAQGTTAALALTDSGDVMDGLEVRVAFNGVWKESLTELSGGQR